VSSGKRWRPLFRLPRFGHRAISRELEHQLDDELAFHIRMREERLAKLGLSPQEARADALARFGDHERIRAECLTIDRQYAREMTMMDWVESLAADLRFALRTLRRAPAFTVITALTLALGVGATTAIFTLVHGILLRPLPYPHAEQLVRVIQSYPEKGLDLWPLSRQNAAAYKKDVTDFSHFGAYYPEGVTLTGDGAPERLMAVHVTGDFFETLGVPATLGRTVRDSEVTKASAPVAVLGYGFWQSHFGGNASVVGKTIDLDGTPTQIIGVMPQGFSFWRPDIPLFLPFAADPAKRYGWFLGGVGRLKPGVTVTHAEHQATGSMWNWARTNKDLLWGSKPIAPETTHMRAIVTPLQTTITGDVRRPLLVLQAAVALLLLIAIANVATLVSSRAAARTPEIAVRTALGASTRRVARQLITESLVVAAVGGIIGLVLAAAAVRSFALWSNNALPRIREVGVDWQVLAFALGISIASGVLFGLAPVFRMVRGRRLADDLAGTQKASARTTTRRLNNTMIVTQIALSLVLLVSAGLLIKSFRRLVQTDLGFEPRGVLTATVPFPMKKYMNRDAAGPATASIVERVRRLPGVREAAATTRVPFTGVNTDGFIVEGRQPPPNAGAETQVVQSAVTPGYFSVLQQPLRYGRDFTTSDRDSSLAVVIVDDAFASRFWKGQDAIGKRMHFTGDMTWRTIVGVTSSVRDQDAAEEGLPHAYTPFAQEPNLEPVLAIATNGEVAPVLAEVRRAVSELEPGAPLANVRVLSDGVSQALANRRMTEILLTAFALLALLLAVVGIYGVMILYVTSRLREFGIRIAIGAEPSRVVRLVLREGLVLGVAGVGLGVAGALIATRWLESLLYRVSPTDPLVFAGLAIALLAVAVASCYRPARRAAAADPALALRVD
jgi:putative ABC transport system permease protein